MKWKHSCELREHKECMGRHSLVVLGDYHFPVEVVTFFFFLKKALFSVVPSTAIESAAHNSLCFVRDPCLALGSKGRSQAETRVDTHSMYTVREMCISSVC